MLLRGVDRMQKNLSDEDLFFFSDVVVALAKRRNLTAVNAEHNRVDICSSDFICITIFFGVSVVVG